MNDLLEIDDDSKVCKLHKGQLHKLQQEIQETQQTKEGVIFV